MFANITVHNHLTAQNVRDSGLIRLAYNLKSKGEVWIKWDDTAELFYLYADMDEGEYVGSARNMIRARSIARHYLILDEEFAEPSVTAYNDCLED